MPESGVGELGQVGLAVPCQPGGIGAQGTARLPDWGIRENGSTDGPLKVLGHHKA
jgi:hypothetical protein